MKFLGINLIKYVRNSCIYEETFKMLMNEIKEELNKWRNIPCPWIERLNIVKDRFYQN